MIPLDIDLLSNGAKITRFWGVFAVFSSKLTAVRFVLLWQ
jgi:hypothetical protein